MTLSVHEHWKQYDSVSKDEYDYTRTKGFMGVLIT